MKHVKNLRSFLLSLFKQCCQAQQFKSVVNHPQRHPQRYLQRYPERYPQSWHSYRHPLLIRLRFNPLALHQRHHRLQVCVHEFLLVGTLFTEPLWKRCYGVIYILQSRGVSSGRVQVSPFISSMSHLPPPSPPYSHHKHIYILYCIMGKQFRHQPEVEHSVVLVTSRPSPLISNHDKLVLLDSSFSGLQSINVILKTFTWEIHAYRTS